MNTFHIDTNKFSKTDKHKFYTNDDTKKLIFYPINLLFENSIKSKIYIWLTNKKVSWTYVNPLNFFVKMVGLINFLVPPRSSWTPSRRHTWRCVKFGYIFINSDLWLHLWREYHFWNHWKSKNLFSLLPWSFKIGFFCNSWLQIRVV